jgi:two-component system sensor histidine kinase BaeS
MLDARITADPIDDAPTDRPPELRPAALLVAVALGVGADIGLRGDPANLVLAIALGGLLVALLVAPTLCASARLLLVAAVVPVTMLALRVSPWLTASNLVITFALIASALLFGRSGSLFAATPATWLRRLGPAAGAVVDVGHDAVATVRPVGGRHAAGLGRVARATAITLPFLVLALLLLADADVVFARLITPDLDAGVGIGHGVVILIAASVVVAAGGVAHRIQGDDVDHAGGFGALEAATMLGSMAAVLTAFVVAQLVALTGAGERLVREAGLTPAEYARSGFFQLCWAVLVITALLAVVRRSCSPQTLDRRAIRWLQAAVPLLTMGLVVVSLRRMAYYDDAFGLTMLRVWVVGATVWIGVMLAVLAVRNLAFPRARSVGGIALLCAYVLIVAANVANPEAYVVRHNTARARSGASVDLRYLGTLSDDAVPQIAETFRDDRAGVRRLIGCKDADGVSRVNLAAERASEVRTSVCRGRVSP